MWEETRRWYLRFLVEEKLWDMMKELADHSLYDDQRGWALGQALEEKQWDVVVVLADHGLTDDQMRRVYRQVAKHANWDTVSQLFDRGVCMRESAVQNKAWNVVMQLVRQGMNVDKRNSLFPMAIQQQQWGLGRALLERGVSVELSRAALPELIEADQWILVARVMELSLDDTERRRAMQVALDKKEGSVVAHGMSVLEGRLSVEERKALFKHALSHGMWQAVKRLVEEKDSTGIAQRDEALVAAVEHNQWDIVDHCQRHEFHGNLNQRDPDGHSALYKLIRLAFGFQRQPARIIDCATLWGSDVGERVDYKGQTALHVVCQAGLWQSIRYIVARGGDPLAVTNDGKTAITAALEYKRKLPAKSKSQGGWEEACEKREAEVRDCRQKLVAECIKLGISTHQPRATDSADSVSRSPVLISIEKKDIVVLHMLYESGACSHRELQKVLDHTFSSDAYQKSEYRNCITYLDQIASTPRRLVSMCRLVISHHLGVHWIRKKRNVPKPRPDMYRIPNTTGVRCNRQTRAEHLPLPRPMRNYVLFSDLVDPDYGKDLRDNEDGVRMKDSKGHGL
nr:hypothetical protein BaRGS_009597 [Batillaria attramentaria]